MKVTATLDAPCSAATMFSWVDDLARYPEWLTILTDVEPDGDGWRVELQGKLGPLARSKRLRMERTVHRPNELVVFERRETDGRNHAAWTLQSTVTESAAGSHLVMDLGYEGKLWGTVIEALLRDEIDQARGRLLTLVS
jgi:Polyketide cyclase / dehydrase and lipid transport